MLVVVAYDIVANGRRTALRKRLRRWFDPIQLSVMEGELDGPQVEGVVATAARAIDPAVDSVRVYTLCRACTAQIRCLGVAPPPVRRRQLIIL